MFDWFKGFISKKEEPKIKCARHDVPVTEYATAPVPVNMNGHVIPLYTATDGSQGVKINDIPEDAMDDVMDYICTNGKISLMFGF